MKIPTSQRVANMQLLGVCLWEQGTIWRESLLQAGEQERIAMLGNGIKGQ